MRSLTVSLLFMAGILVGILIKGGQQRKQTINVEGVSKFDEVMWYVGNDYVDVPDAQKLQDDAIAAMMDNLDPHSAYVSLEEFNEMNEPLLGSFDGIGVQFRLEKDTIAVVSVIKGACPGLRSRSAYRSSAPGPCPRPG